MTLLDRIVRHPIGLGTAPLGSRAEGPLWWGPQDRDEAIETVRVAIDAGVAFIDTAPFYGWGLAEEIVGAAIVGSTDRPPILSKCGTVRNEAGEPTDDASPAAVRRGVEATLERLGVDHVDVIQVHDPDPRTPIEDTWDALMSLVAEGVIGGAGLSNHPVELMDRALAVGPIAVVQHQYSALWQRRRTDGTIAWCRDRGVPFLAWAPLASGFLVDDFDLGSLHPEDLRHGLPWASDRADATNTVRSTLAGVAARAGTDLLGAALAYATHERGVAAIVGARTPAEAAALGQPIASLSRDAVEVIDALDAG